MSCQSWVHQRFGLPQHTASSLTRLSNSATGNSRNTHCDASSMQLHAACKLSTALAAFTNMCTCSAFRCSALCCIDVAMNRCVDGSCCMYTEVTSDKVQPRHSHIASMFSLQNAASRGLPVHQGCGSEGGSSDMACSIAAGCLHCSLQLAALPSITIHWLPKVPSSQGMPHPQGAQAHVASQT